MGNWSRALVRNGMDEWEGWVDEGTSTDDNEHNNPSNIICSYQLRCSILAMGTQAVRP